MKIYQFVNLLSNDNRANITSTCADHKEARIELSIDYKAIGERIRQFRISKNMTQESLAEAVAITRGHLGRIEVGLRYPSLEIILLIANCLEVTADDLLYDNLKHSDSPTVQEIHDLLLTCNANETVLMARILVFMKELLSDYDI